MDNLATYENQARTNRRKVFYTGTDALLKGVPLAYDFDDTGDGISGNGQEADDAWGGRGKRVVKPSANTEHFAGATVTSYTANASGQWIEIYEPGSECEVYCKVNCTVGSTVLNWDYTLNYFMNDASNQGYGAALALQTVDRSSTAGLVFAKLLDGARVAATS